MNSLDRLNLILEYYKMPKVHHDSLYPWGTTHEVLFSVDRKAGVDTSGGLGSLLYYTKFKRPFAQAARNYVGVRIRSHEELIAAGELASGLANLPMPKKGEAA